MRLTIEKIKSGDYSLFDLNEDDYHKVWTVLRMSIDESEMNHGDIGERRFLQKQMNDLINENDRRTKLICSVCGKNASWNTPYLVEDNGKYSIVCDTCAKDDMTGRLFVGIEQRSTWKGDLKYSRNQEYLRNRCVIVFYRNEHGGWTEGAYSYKGRYLTFGNPMPSVNAWINGGQTCFPLQDLEKVLAIKDPLFVLKMMEETTTAGHFRCTTCGQLFNEKDCAGYPLFAGKVCGACWKLHQDKLEKERKEGHVCSMCRQPYSNCCC